MSTFLVVNNSSMLCSSTANLPYVQVENEYLPLTTQTDRGRIDVHITDEYTTYNVINLTTTTKEMTVEETVATTGYSGTYEDYIGTGTIISNNSVSVFRQQMRGISSNGVRYSSGNNAFLVTNTIMSTPQTFSYTFYSNTNGGRVGATTYTASNNGDVMPLNFRDGLKNASSTYTKANYVSVLYDGGVGTFKTTSLVSSTTNTYKNVKTTSRSTQYSNSTYYGSGRIYDGVSTYTSYNSVSDSIASIYTEITLSSFSTLTQTVTEEVTSSSFTTSTYTETQTRETTEWSGATTSSSSSSGIFISHQYRITDCATLYSNSVANTGNIAQEINASFSQPFNVTQTLGVNIAGYQEITQFYLTFYDRTTTQITSYPPQQKTWFITSYPQCITNESGDPERTSVTVCSVTQFASMASDKTISTSSYSDGRTRTISSATTISYLNGNSTATMLGLTSTTSSESNASCSESYAITITDTFTHTMTITGEVN